MLNSKILLCLSTLVLLSGCGKKAANVTGDDMSCDNENNPIAVLHQFEAEVEGIECALCAQDVVDLFSTIDGVEYVDFIMSGTEYEQGYIRFSYDVNKKNLNLQSIDERLQDEGFELLSLDGAFYIEPFFHKGKQFVAFDQETALPFCYSNNIESVKRMVKRYDDNMLFAQGKIKKDLDAETFIFTLHS